MNKGRCFGFQGSMVKSFLKIMTSASILMLSIQKWSAASQKLEEQVRRNILHNNPEDCERVLDMDFSKKQIFILCRTVGRDILEKVVPRNHLPKTIKITAEDRKSIISIKEAFSKKGGKQNKVLLPVKKNRTAQMSSAPKLSLMQEDIKDLKRGLRKIWEQDTDTCRRCMANGMDQGEKFFIALCRLNN